MKFRVLELRLQLVQLLVETVAFGWNGVKFSEFAAHGFELAMEFFHAFRKLCKMLCDGFELIGMRNQRSVPGVTAHQFVLNQGCESI